MTLIRKLVSVACWVLLSTSYSVSNAQSTSGQLDPTQVYTTGNIVQPTVSGTNSTPWVNGVYQDNLTCWAGGDPGYCGPNAIVRPGNNINFSYGLTNLYQMQSVADALPNSGTGLRVNGYNFSFTAKNGNGWDDGRLDVLSAYVNFYNPQGSSVFNKNYDLNSKFDWTAFNYSETFNSPFAAKNLGSVQYGFVGRDNNFWAGPYGPEIYNVSFSLKYSVDPCSVNVLSSPSCPGYMDQINKFNPTPNTVETALLPPPPPGALSGVNESLALLPPPPPPGPVPAQGPGPGPSPGNQGPGPGPAQGPGPGSAPAPTASLTAASTAQTERAVAGPSLSTILGIIRNEQSRIAGVETAAVTQANEVASTLSTQAQQQAEQTAASAVAASQTIQQTERTISTPTSNIQSNIFTQTSTSRISSGVVQGPSLQASQGSIEAPSQSIVVGLVRPQPEIITYQPPAVTFSTGGPQSLTRRVEETNNNTSSNFSSSTAISLIPEVRKIEPVRIQEQEVNRQASIDFTGRSPIRDYLDSRPPVSQDSGRIEPKTTEVKRNVQDNEAAGGVTLTAMAKQPPGFELYMMGMRDVAFYAPKEIYKNQKVIDNQRVLRQLNSRSDRLHEEMVNEQYKN